ncbi:hypothetical protein [Pasteurella testudinis]|uniref:hypothetical protein n=1 Tax=Pasteurella testudinis TaxID=761 RepID=UPI001FC9114F|nr:hypothetical protein [Pasteurella testudinis]
MWRNKISAWCGAIYWREALLGVPGIVLVLAFSDVFNSTQLVVMLGAAIANRLHHVVCLFQPEKCRAAARHVADCCQSIMAICHCNRSCGCYSLMQCAIFWSKK